MVARSSIKVMSLEEKSVVAKSIFQGQLFVVQQAGGRVAGGGMSATQAEIQPAFGQPFVWTSLAITPLALFRYA